MKRRIFDSIISWDKSSDQKALLLSGAPGVGKTYLALEFAKGFHNSYLYLNPKNDCKLRNALLELSVCTTNDFTVFLQNYYGIPAEWFHEFLVIIDDYDYYGELITLTETVTAEQLSYRLLLVSTLTPTKTLINQCQLINITPLEFDEYLKAIGSEWYTDIIQAHFQTKKKIPEIVHTEMLNLFRDYLRIGGMPAAVNEYLHTDNLENVSSIHRNLYHSFQSQFQRYSESSMIRMNQLSEHLTEQLVKENKNFRYNLIRKGATHSMYCTELNQLIDLHLVNKIERADFVVENNRTDIVTHDNQFRLYPLDTGMLYSKIMSERIEFTDETEEDGTDNISNHLYQLLSEAYLMQTLSSRQQRPVFWESGSLSKIDFISTFDNRIMPIDIKFFENKRSKSMHVFRQKYPVSSYMKFGMHNFEIIDNIVTCPIYSLFCL